MTLDFPVQAKILQPIDEVFDSVYNPRKLSSYFATGGASGPMDAGQTVIWEFADFPGPFPVTIKEMKKNEKLSFFWPASDGAGGAADYKTTVEITFKAIDNNITQVKIVETGWNDGEASLKAAVSNAQGWMQVICCLKAFVEYGINLRKGFL